MFAILSSSKAGKTLISAALVLTSMSAKAELTPYHSNGVDLVYSSVSDVTWTKDANLLGSLFANQGFSTVVNAIIDASPTISHPDGTYTLTANDFRSDGLTNWYGVTAYVNYLNSINYASSNQWRLPTFTAPEYGFDKSSNGTTTGDELSELYYQELKSEAWPAAGFGIKDSNNTFSNEQYYAYWSSTEYTLPGYAWVFYTAYGSQSTGSDFNLFYAWAVSPGQISAVPEPESVVMLLAGLALLGIAVRRTK